MHSPPREHSAKSSDKVDWGAFLHVKYCADVSTQRGLELLDIGCIQGGQCAEITETPLDHRAVELHLEGSARVADQAIPLEVNGPKVVEMVQHASDSIIIAQVTSQGIAQVAVARSPPYLSTVIEFQRG
jgi:hypothetical protein